VLAGPASALQPPVPAPARPPGSTDGGSPATVPGNAAGPVLPGASPATAVARRPGGPSKETVALLGVVCAAVLVRYLAYSTKLRRR
jgi:hypothetical protein